MSGGIYKVRISRSKVSVKYYAFDGNDEYREVSGNIDLDDFELGELFYTIGMNYTSRPILFIT